MKKMWSKNEGKEHFWGLKLCRCGGEPLTAANHEKKRSRRVHDLAVNDLLVILRQEQFFLDE